MGARIQKTMAGIPTPPESQGASPGTQFSSLDKFDEGGVHIPGEEYMMGIDEAGRGPAIGSMMYGCCLCPLGRESDVKKMGFMDSKTLTDAKRQAFFKTIKRNDWLLWHTHSISPVTISNSMLRSKKYSLNQLSHDSAIGMIQHFLNKGVNITQLYVDTVGIAEYYQAKL